MTAQIVSSSHTLTANCQLPNCQLIKVDLTGFEPVTSRVTGEVTLAPHYCALAFDVNKKNRLEENASALKIRPKRSNAKSHYPPV